MRHNEKEFTERVREASDQNQEKTVKECKQKINKAQKRHKELDVLVKKLYEGNATGKIPDRHFTRLPAEYDEEQTGLEASIAEWQRQIESWNADRLKTDQFIQLVKRYTNFSELTTPMLNEFIEKVIVHEGEGRGNDRRQRRQSWQSRGQILPKPLGNPGRKCMRKPPQEIPKRWNAMRIILPQGGKHTTGKNRKQREPHSRPV